jgi:hypothetical protein
LEEVLDLASMAWAAWSIRSQREIAANVIRPHRTAIFTAVVYGENRAKFGTPETAWFESASPPTTPTSE